MTDKEIIKALELCTSEGLVCAGVVSVGVLQQVIWERDTAIEQLEDYGVGLGEVADLVKVVRCKDCKHCDTDIFKRTVCNRTFMMVETSPTNFCSYGDRGE